MRRLLLIPGYTHSYPKNFTDNGDTTVENIGTDSNYYAIFVNLNFKILQDLTLTIGASFIVCSLATKSARMVDTRIRRGTIVTTIIAFVDIILTGKTWEL